MVAQLSQRLMAIQANPDTAELGAFERMQAQQAIATLDKAKRRDQELATYLAERRVEIAETAVRTALAAREVDRLERTRSDLLIEASRRDAARARQEAEQLRMQAQMQAEEAERLRQAAEAETLARQDAENALTSVAGKQQQRLSAAQQNAAKLAREEAELVSGQKLPASKFDGRGEVFTFRGDAFTAGASSLSGGPQPGQGVGRIPEHRQEGPPAHRGLRQRERRRPEACRSAARCPGRGRCRQQPDPARWQEGGLHPGAFGRGHHRPVIA